MVKYVYDAWGNHAVLDADGNDITDETNIGILNPFRYRGYYYDTETGLYYLQTRYYDPELCRFITIDGIEYLDPEHINGLNLYAYCGNNPVMRTDPEGTEWWHWLLGFIIIAAAVVLTVATAGIGTAITGALGGGLLASMAGGMVAGAIGGAITSFGFSIASQGIINGFNNIDWNQVGIDTLVGFASGAISGAIFGGLSFAMSSKQFVGSFSKMIKTSSALFDTLDKPKIFLNTFKTIFAFLKGAATPMLPLRKSYYIARAIGFIVYQGSRALLKFEIGGLIKLAGKIDF